jgi:hypothetical protein
MRFSYELLYIYIFNTVFLLAILWVVSSLNILFLCSKIDVFREMLNVIAMTDFSETQPLQSNYIFKEIERTTMMVDNAKTKYSKRKQPTILPKGKLC